MKKSVLLVLSLIILFSFNACGSEKNTVNEFISPVIEKYDVDLSCTDITPLYKNSDNTPYVFEFSSDKYYDLSIEDKVNILKMLDSLNIKNAGDYMDIESGSAKKLSEKLEKNGHGSFNVKGIAGVIISSNKKEYGVESVYELKTSDYTFRNCELVDHEALLDEDGYYLLESDSSTSTCEILTLYEGIMPLNEYISQLHRLVDKLNKGSGKCPTCNGTGYIRYYYGESSLEALLDGEPDSTVEKCYTCGGTGRAN